MHASCYAEVENLKMSSRSSSRTLGVRPPSSGSRRSSTKESPSSGQNSVGSKDLLSREEEYMRLNAELEAKTASLIQEAEEVMREQDSILNHSFNRLDLRTSCDVGVEGTRASVFETEPTDLPDDSPKQHPGSTSSLSNRPGSSNGKPNSAHLQGRTTTAGSKGRPNTAGSRPPSAKAANKVKKRPKKQASSGTSADDVAVPRQGMDSFNLGDTISSIERRMEDGDLDGEMDDILPQAAEGMGSEATIRFLKAKLRVMQEELDSLSQECNQRTETNTKLEAKVKELEDDKVRLNRSHQSQVNQIDKYKKLADDAKRKSDGLETQLAGLRKELESLKRSTKSSASTHSATEVRLNRALEEVEKYKTELQRAKLSSRESTDADKKRTEQLLAENRRLEKQKTELMAGFKKQLKLIDILKKQKMHIEAAKLLSFTEEEFVKALEWGSG